MRYLAAQMLMESAFAWEQIVPLGVIAVATLLLMSSMRRRQRVRAQQPPRVTPLRSQPEPGGDHARLCRDLESLMVELQELSRKISAQIDTRFAKLEAAIRDADRRIAVLTRLSNQTEDSAGPPVERSREPGSSHSAVYELADAGFSAVDIARELGRTTGEVELILNLRTKTSTSKRTTQKL